MKKPLKAPPQYAQEPDDADEDKKVRNKMTFDFLNLGGKI